MASSSSSLANYIFIFSSILFIQSLCSGGSGRGCIESERDALLQFKNGLYVSSNRLYDWVSDGSDCCRWTAVVCHNITDHVIELHLRTLSPEEYYGSDRFLTLYDDSEYIEYYQKSALGGKVSDSLLQLKHLSYLDVSFNDFGGVPIPRFLGSLQSLRYLNLSKAGFGGMIPPQLGNLSNLQYLNLQSTYMYDLHVESLDWISSLSSLEFLDMSYVDLSQSFDWLNLMNSLSSLLELHLSGCSLSDFNPSLNSSSLLVLDLSDNSFQGPIPNGLQNMTSSFLTRELDLSSNHFNSSIPDWLYHLTNLQLLDLRLNQLEDQISSADIGNLTSLVTLDMSFNSDLELKNGIPKSFSNFCNLRSIQLSRIKLNQEINDVSEILSSGCVSDVLQSLSLDRLSGYLTDNMGQHFRNLRHLSLHSTGDLIIHGPIPTSFKNLCNLRSLSFRGVKLNQEINDVLTIMSSGCVSNVLRSLELANCELSGHLTDDLSYFKNLITFDISYNSISGPIPLSLGEMNSLAYLEFSNNRLNGSLPVSFGDLKELHRVYVYNNKLEGEVSNLHFANLTSLFYFDASGNNISLRVNPDWIPPLQLVVLKLGSWQIGSQFPDWIRLLKHLTYLDLSNSGISTPFPIWFWDLFRNYEVLILSQNQMHGSLPNIPFANGFMPVIDLSSNNFSGEIPYFSSNVTALDLSKNSFTGSIFHFLCNNMNEEKQMQVLNLDRNFLHGEIPDCWSSWKELAALKLSNNMFSGNIPDTIGTLSFLQSLNLHNNNLSGEIPSSIQNCKRLFTLDFSENILVGNVPTWIGDRFADLGILSLHTNMLDGYLPRELCHLVSLHILNLARNSFSGTIPSCFGNFTGMAIRNDSTGSIYTDNSRIEFMESSLLVMKGKVMEYSTNLRFLRSIDLSNNNLSGEIPTEITSIAGLLSLNLSQNALTGRIPNNIGDMKGLEAIDFSHNQLSGEIPESMTTLTFLGTLDLSYNNLSGRIPSGTQLRSFNSSSFIGNQLCGLPLTKNCSVDNHEPDIEDNGENEDKDEVDIWFYASMAFGFVFGFWNLVGSLVFIRRWRNFYFRCVHHLGEKIWWNFFGRFH